VSVHARTRRGRLAATAVTLVITALAATGAAALPAGAATSGTHPSAGVTHAVSPVAQRATRAFWTRSRMAAATPDTGYRAGRQAGPPPQIPYPTHFDGVPTVGALFFTTGTGAHFCTASVVNSLTANLILTAAHCVYGSTYASNIAFVPMYHHGQRPYGAWPVESITVATGWRQSHNQNLDFAFLTVAPPAGTHRPIQFVTGGLWLGIDLGFAHPIEVIGYNNTGNGPIGCATTSFQAAPRQMKFYCHDFQDGTSGGPWILGYRPSDGTGTVFGVIGGHDQGGNYTHSSYSAYFGKMTLRLFVQAERQQA
jgi:V8-like Glu-specific endopeptidase